jgi:hypothetical protein
MKKKYGFTLNKHSASKYKEITTDDDPVGVETCHDHH